MQKLEAISLYIHGIILLLHLEVTQGHRHLHGGPYHLVVSLILY